MTPEFKHGLGDQNTIPYLFSFSQEYNKIPKRTIGANANISHVFKTNNFRDGQSLYQDKPSTDMTLNELRILTSTCWNEKYQVLTIEMLNAYILADFFLGPGSLFIPHTKSF